MLSSIKHITAILLLVIFPVSAIGVDVSVHSCQEKGKTLLSLHSIDSKAGMACCCSHLSGNSKDSKMGSCCHMNHKQKSSKKTDATGYGLAVSQSSGHSCCSKSHKSVRDNKKAAHISDELINNNDAYSTGSGSQNGKTGAVYKDVSCCSQSDVCYSVNVVSVSLESADKLLIDPILIPEALPGFKSLSQHTIYNLDKIQNYPLKEPVCHIISFIYLTSNSGDDTDLPHTLSC
jgi:hypothetical protein